jgi:hypothetical protein
MVMNLRVPLNIGKFLSSCTTGGFSRRAHLHKVISRQKSYEIAHCKITIFGVEWRNSIGQKNTRCNGGYAEQGYYMISNFEYPTLLY